MTYARKVVAARVGLFVVILLALETAARQIGAAGDLLPPPSVIAAHLPALLHDPKIVWALAMLIGQLATAFLCSMLFGAVLGYAVAASPRVERIGLPVVLLVYTIPQITILPVFVLVFGLGSAAKIAFGISHGIFPIALGVISGVQKARLHPIYVRWADSLGASRGQKLRRILIPQAIGSVCTGARLSMATALLGIVLADLYVSDNGVGYFIKLFTDTQQGSSLFALVTMLVLAAIAINALVSRFERYATRWMA